MHLLRQDAQGDPVNAAMHVPAVMPRVTEVDLRTVDRCRKTVDRAWAMPPFGPNATRSSMHSRRSKSWQPRPMAKH